MADVLTRENLRDVGLIGGLLFVVGAWMNGNLVSGKDHEKALAEKDKWMAISLELLQDKKNSIPPVFTSGPSQMSKVDSVPFTPEEAVEQIKIIKGND